MTLQPPPSEASVLPQAPSPYRGAWVHVDLEAIVANARRLDSEAEPAELLAVVKADAYGHGAVPVARALEGAGFGWFAVANVEEGVELRDGGVEGQILVLGPARAEERGPFLKHRLTPVVSSFEELDVWEGGPGGPRVDLHLKVDTGMSRLGFSLDELADALRRIRGSERLRMTGFLSHLARADEPEHAFNREQIEAFEGALGQLTEQERATAVVHLANSGAHLHLPGTGHSLVRCGLALYGLDPARRRDDLVPALSVHARIGRLRSLPAGRRVGYSGTWEARRPSRLAVIPVGYADGYPLALSNRAEVLVDGRRVPVAGRISMDMTALDVTDVEAEVGDEVVLLGRQQEEEITAWELADRAQSIPWEILCAFKQRLPIRYTPPAAWGSGGPR